VNSHESLGGAAAGITSALGRGRRPSRRAVQANDGHPASAASTGRTWTELPAPRALPSALRQLLPGDGVPQVEGPTRDRMRLSTAPPQPRAAPRSARGPHVRALPQTTRSVARGPSIFSIKIEWTTTRGALAPLDAARASSYSRRPSWWIAEYIGGTCLIRPTNAPQASSRRAGARSSDASPTGLVRSRRACPSSNRSAPSRGIPCPGRRDTGVSSSPPRRGSAAPGRVGSSVPACPIGARRDAASDARRRMRSRRGPWSTTRPGSHGVALTSSASHRPPDGPRRHGPCRIGSGPAMVTRRRDVASAADCAAISGRPRRPCRASSP